MSDVNISLFECADWERSCARIDSLHEYKPNYYSEPLNSESVEKAKDSEVISVFIYSIINKSVLEKLPNLKMIATRSTGYDQIDLEECARRKIVVSNVPNYGENTVAEHAFGLILSLSRKIYKAYTRTSKLDFSIENLQGFDLKGRTIGVVGAGRIGLHVVRIAKGFGMEVLVFDVRQEPLLSEVLGFSYAGIDELLMKSDVITLHVPLNKHTYHLINKSNINLIKRGALIINTSRGAIIETEALVSALNEGIISGAGLDVFEGEEVVKEEPELLKKQLSGEKLKEVVLSYSLLHRDNVVITPHVAFYSSEALQRILETTAKNIIAYLKGNPINTVTQ